MKIQRYGEQKVYVHGVPEIGGTWKTLDDNGEWCKYSDVEPLLREREEMMELLHDAIGLLSNHVHHLDRGWIKDYDSVMERYDHITGEVKR